MDSVEFTDVFMNRFYLDGIFKGEYPVKFLKRVKLLMPKIEYADMETISQPKDFLGVNYYNRVFAEHKWYIPILKTWVEGSPTDKRYYHPELGDLGYPEGLKELVRRYRDEYGNPTVFITENGTAEEGNVKEMGFTNDPYLQKFIRLYLESLKEAIDEGCNIKGYFYWSLIDNLEWNQGYTHPMGLLKVDYDTQKRTIRDSAYWYRDLIVGQKSRE